ncbi:3-hydroxyacyl-CoA dehydrogenase NAD-binding domain-containing protein [Adhaeretor mobilis]|uniref:enoyl-CoA hydratase n=1 Tax=Adhaeretor mobilis TaxID=1930276 RepID=A0A517MPH7_9BACT|nr:3-hydroxyacyl-CoA dehydrogenase NAD-binding domain-containing protein [Adhaeretor mobilis]QDS96779.1 Fatty acid oxidation complex subunit alpha [Adhaeretor mobilis]
MSDSSLLSLAIRNEEFGDVAVLTLNDPNKGANVLSQSVLVDFEKHLDDLEDRDGIVGLVIRSTKPGNFIAGADLKEFVADIDLPAEEVVKVAQRGQQLFGRLAKVPFVTIAAIDGVCLGGGAELAIWCDRRIMMDNAQTSFAFPEVKLGLFPGWGGTARTPRIVGLANAVELVTSGEGIDAKAAQAMGLAQDVVQVSPHRPDAEKDETSHEEPLLEAALRMVCHEAEHKDYLKDRDCWAAPISSEEGGISDTELGFLGATASAYIQQQTKGNYPAPLAALEVMLGAAGVDVEQACQMEAEGFTEVFGSPVNRALLNVFFLRDANKKQAGTDAEPAKINSAAVVGAGIMGQGIAAASVKRGLPTALGDISAEAVGRGVQGVLTEVSYNKQIKGPDVAKALEYTPLINGTLSDGEIANADIVIEAIYENQEAKQELYARLEPHLSESTLLCTNTSTIPVTSLAESLERPENFCGLHFFNPVRRMPLVEVIRGEKTSDQTIATAVAYSKKLGKSPVVVSDGPGFLVNRVLLPYMNEALLLLEEGASIKAVDRAAKSFGMPMGPIELYDTVGLDVAIHAGGVMHAAFPDRIEPSSILPAMVEAGRKGKKNGQGFFDYPKSKKGRPVPSDEANAIIAKHVTASKEFKSKELTERLMLPMLLEATRVLEDGVAHSVADVDLALIFGIGFPPFRGGLFFWADHVGAAKILEQLGEYQELGKRYEPTDFLKKTAEGDGKFYPH